MPRSRATRERHRRSTDFSRAVPYARPALAVVITGAPAVSNTYRRVITPLPWSSRGILMKTLTRKQRNPYDVSPQLTGVREQDRLRHTRPGVGGNHRRRLWPLDPGCNTRGSAAALPAALSQSGSAANANRVRTPFLEAFQDCSAIYFVGLTRSDGCGSKQTRTADPFLVRERQRIRSCPSPSDLPSEQGIWKSADSRGRSQMVCKKVCKPLRAYYATTVVMGGDTKIN
jgi:hypothetical protein